MRLSLVAVCLSNKITGVLRGADVCHEELQDQAELDDIEKERDSAKNDSAQERQDSADKAVSKSHEREEDQSCPGESCQNDEQNVDEGGELQGDKAAEGEVKQRLEEARALRRTTVLCGLLRVLIVLWRGSKGRVLLTEALLFLRTKALLALGAEPLLLLSTKALVLLLVATKTGRGVGVRSLGAEAITRLLPKTLALVGFCLRTAAKAFAAKAAVAVTVVAVALIRVRRLSGVLGASTAIGVVGSVGGAKRVMVSAGVMAFRLVVR